MRVLVAEDESLFRQGLVGLLRGEGMEIVGESGDADSTVELTRRLGPDVVITDIRMPPTMRNDGFEAALRLRREMPRLPVVVLTQHTSRSAALELVRTGNRVGYLLKQRVSDIVAFAAIVRRVVAGATALDPEVGQAIASAAAAREQLSRLTPRQLEVLARMAEGRSNAAIAKELVVTEKAVVRHTSRIYDALGISLDGDDHRRVLAVLRYLTCG
jgi:DNA-binding NarL/FixJ family response regulator